MTKRKAVVTTAFEPEAGALYEIEVAEGDIVELTEKDAPEGWMVVEIDGMEGMVPEGYLRILREGATSPDAIAGEAEDGQLDGLEVDDEDEDDANRRMALYDFEAEPGSIYELPLVKGEIVELTEEDAPDGWVAALSLSSDKIGLVPEVYLGPAPRSRPDAPTQEELELKKAKEEKAKLEQELKALEAEKKRVEEEKEIALEEAAEREEKLKKDMEEVEAREVERLEQEAKRKEAFDEEVKALENRKLEMAEEEKIWPSTDQKQLKAALAAAEKRRLEAEETYHTIRLSADQAEQRLKDAARAEKEAADKLRENERQRDANTRAMKLLPGLRELLAPTQEELKLCVETVTNAVMKNAEESAQLLAKLALTQDPDEALQEAIAKRQEGIEKLGFSRSQGGIDRMASSSLPSTRMKVADRTDQPQPPRADPKPVMTAAPPMPQPPTGAPPTSGRRLQARSAQSRSTPQSVGQSSALQPITNAKMRSSMPERLKATVGGNRRVTLDSASTMSTSPRHMVGSHGRRPARGPAEATTTRSPRRPGLSPAAEALRVDQQRELQRRPNTATASQATDGSFTASASTLGMSASLPLDTLETPEALASMQLSAQEEVPSSEQPDSSQGVGSADAAALPDGILPEPQKQPAWKQMESVAPNTRKPARMMEKQQRKLRKDLRDTRKAIVKGDFGHINVRIPDQTERVQQRTSHATYTYMMRQRKARQDLQALRDGWDNSFTRF